ncbi:MAG: DUF370 domain-containing protein [Ruminococcus sp.]|nr:DUF370 domain-containing protein [Ruminococcus sp.]
MKLLNVGNGNVVAADRVIAMVAPDSAPIKRIVSEAKSKGTLIDATYGRKTRTVIVMDSDHVVLSGIETVTLANRTEDKN